MRIKGLFVILLGLTVVALQCGAAPAPAPTSPPPTEAAAPTEAAPAPTEAAGPIHIGISLPLTGRRSEPGTATKQGYEIWAEFVNNAGGLLGRQVELSILDNASDPDTAVSDYEKLITVDKVDLVVGPFSSALVFPSAAVAQKYGYAFIEPAGGAPEIFERCFSVLFFAQPAAGRFQADTFAEMVQALPADQQPKTIAYPTVDDPFNKGVIERARELFEEAGYETVYFEVFPQEVTDFSSIALSIKASNADMVVAGTIFGEAVGLTRSLQEVAYHPKIAFMTTAPSLPEFGEALGQATEGIIAAVSWHTSFKTFQNEEFVDRHRELYGGDPAEDAANGFTVGQVLEQAVNATGSIDNATLVEYLHKAEFDTVVGGLSFDECGRPQGYFHQLQWQDGQIEIVWPEEAATAELIVPKPEW